MKEETKIRSDVVTRGVNLFRNNEFDLVPIVVRMLAEGRPVRIKDLAFKAGWTEKKVSEELSQHPSIEYDDQGHIVGFGMTLNPTSHQFDFNGKTVFGWCASDVLAFPVLLGESGVVSSSCPITKQNIKIKVTPDAILEVDPPGAVVSSIRPTTQVKDVRSEICSLGLFFSSRDAASDWLAAYPDGFLHSVQEDFEVHRQVFIELGWVK